MGDVHGVLDAYVTSVERVLGRAIPGLSAPPDAVLVRSALDSHVAEPLDDLVDFWSWRAFTPEYGVGLFAAAGPVSPLDRWPLEVESLRDNLRETAYILSQEGPLIYELDIDSAIPVTCGSSATVIVDCGEGPSRGRIYHCDLHGADETTWLVEMFGSLADAIDAARYCVEAGFWLPRVIQNSRTGEDAVWVEAPGRLHTVTPDDIVWPPFGQPPS